MKCKRCGNADKSWFHKDDIGTYCRKCIMFGRLNVDTELKTRNLNSVEKKTQMKLDYSLTKSQIEISRSLIEKIQLKDSSLVYAACGAGKTEIVMPVIEYCINNGIRIGFAISRREVVVELSQRLKKVFNNLDIIPVCEGYTSRDDADLIVCTTHQLYRYHKSFDVLILDEIDAFPYAGNDVLEQIAMNSVTSCVIYLTATPDHHLLERVKQKELALFELYQRPHGYPLIVPVVKRMPAFIQLIRLVRELIQLVKEVKPVLVFVPTIVWTNYLKTILSLKFRVASISSKSDDKESVMKAFQDGEIDILISTTILERGITISDVQVIVLFGDHSVFNESSLIQITGRVGRKKEHPTGKAVIYCERETSAIKNCVNTLKRMNENV